MDTCHLLSGQVVVVVVSLTLIVIGPFQKVGLGQKLQFATRRNKTNQIRIRKRELDASNNRSFASEIVSSDYEVTALILSQVEYAMRCRLSKSTTSNI